MWGTGQVGAVPQAWRKVQRGGKHPSALHPPWFGLPLSMFWSRTPTLGAHPAQEPGSWPPTARCLLLTKYPVGMGGDGTMERDWSATVSYLQPMQSPLRSPRHLGPDTTWVSFHRCSVPPPAAGTCGRWFLSQEGTNLLNALGALEEPARGDGSPGHVKARQTLPEKISDLGSETPRAG